MLLFTFKYWLLPYDLIYVISVDSFEILGWESHCHNVGFDVFGIVYKLSKKIIEKKNTVSLHNTCTLKLWVTVEKVEW